MSYPRQVEIEIPLLKVLAELGGASPPREVYGRVAKHFPTLTSEELEERLPNYPSTRKWTNLVQWVRQRLVDSGDIDGTEGGVWKISQAGRQRILSTDQSKLPETIRFQQPTLRDIVNQNRDETKARLITEMQQLSPRAFEHFCRELLTQLGFRSVEVTPASQDGGIDGFGDFRQGVISIRSAFQAKRWTDAAVGRPEIDRFRGAIQGEFDHGVFLTTSRFSRDAIQASFRKGAITILLLDGPAIAELLLERGLGVRKSPLFLYDVDSEFFEIDDE